MMCRTFAVLSLGLGLLVGAPAQAKSVSAEGQAMIQNGDEPAARDRALEDAQRKAVEAAVGTMISAETVMENYQIVSDRILAKSTGYIKSYTIASSGADKGIYRVTINAVVEAGKLNGDVDAIGALLRRKGMPRAFVVVPEVSQTNDGMVDQHQRLVESLIQEGMMNTGFTLIDPNVLSGKMDLETVYRKGDVPGDIARRIGKLANAEVVVYGSAKVQVKALGKMLGNHESVQALVNLRVVNISNGQIIANYVLSHPKRSLTNAPGVPDRVARSAGEVAAGGVINKIAAAWQREANGSLRVVLTVRGVKYQSAKKLKAKIANLRGVTSVQQRSVKGGKGVFDVQLKGNAQALADMLDGLKAGRQTLEVTGLEGETISAELGK